MKNMDAKTIVIRAEILSWLRHELWALFSSKDLKFSTITSKTSKAVPMTA